MESKPVNTKTTESTARIQRREFVRVGFKTAVQFKDVSRTKAGGEQFDELPWEEAITQSLSAGGLGCNAPREIPSGALLAVRLKLPGVDRAFQTIGRIARCVSDSNTSNWYWGIELLTQDQISARSGDVDLDRIPDSFKSFGERERNALVSFVFKEEISVRKRKTLEEESR
jgi:c-di-GMP-binding flagellar brake protein YcgR